jgi:hypothetical protein
LDKNAYRYAIFFAKKVPVWFDERQDVPVWHTVSCRPLQALRRSKDRREGGVKMERKGRVGGKKSMGGGKEI